MRDINPFHNERHTKYQRTTQTNWHITSVTLNTITPYLSVKQLSFINPMVHFDPWPRDLVHNTDLSTGPCLIYDTVSVGRKKDCMQRNQPLQTWATKAPARDDSVRVRGQSGLIAQHLSTMPASIPWLGDPNMNLLCDWLHYGGVEGPPHIFFRHHAISYGWLSNSSVGDSNYCYVNRRTY